MHEKTENVEFIIGDINKRVIDDDRFRPESSDYTFSRLLVCGITTRPDYMKAVFSLPEPGGWTEINEFKLNLLDKDVRSLYQDRVWPNGSLKVPANKGYNLFCGERLQQYMRSAGFVDVSVKPYRWTWTRQP